MSQEPVRQWLSARVRRGIARPDKLDTLQPHELLLPGVPPGPVEPVVLDHLPEERDDPLCAVAVHVGEVYLVAEHDQPHAQLHRREHHAIGCLPVLAVVVQSLEQQLRGGGRAEVEADHLHVGQRAEGGEEGHSLTRAGRAAEDHRLVLGQPGVEQGLVPHGVKGGHHHVRGGHLVSLHLHLGHLGRPGHPVTRHGHLNDTGSPREKRKAVTITVYETSANIKLNVILSGNAFLFLMHDSKYVFQAGQGTRRDNYDLPSNYSIPI